MTHSDLAAHLARYLDGRIAPTDDEPDVRRSTAARLYGLEVCDADGVVEGADGAARFICLAIGPPYELLAAFGASIVDRFDAIGLSVSGNAFNLDDPCGPRRRVRTTTVTMPDSAASVVTFLESGEAAVADDPHGELAEAMTRLWSADEQHAADRRVA